MASGGVILVPTEMFVNASSEEASRRVRMTALLLVAGLLAGPVGTHVYWMAGGAWGLQGSPNTLGIRIVAAAVVMLLVAAILIVLARVGFWQQRLVPPRLIRLLAWGLAVFFLGHGFVSFAEAAAGVEVEWWLYGPSGLVIGLLALVVAGSGDRRARAHPRRRKATGD